MTVVRGLRIGHICQAIATILACLVISLSLTPPAVAATLFAYPGPDTGNDGLELTEFTVDGAKPLKLNDSLAVTFQLRNVGKYPVPFGKEGVFVAAVDPSGRSRNFGHTYQGTVLDPGRSIILKAMLELDQPGVWTIWPSYYAETTEFQREHYGPTRWHAAQLEVAPGLPDLVIEDLAWAPPSPQAGEQTLVKLIVANRGEAPAAACLLGFQARGELSTHPVQSLKPGEATAVYLENVPLAFPAAGEYTIQVAVDIGQQVQESKEDNNARSGIIHVAAAASLTVSVTTDPPDIRAGENSRVTIRVAQGERPVPGARVSLSVAPGEIAPVEGMSGEQGQFSAKYYAPQVASPQRVRVVAVASTETSKGEGLGWVTVIPATPEPPPSPPPPPAAPPRLSVYVSADPPEVVSGQTSQVTVRVTLSDRPIAGARVSLSADQGRLGPVRGSFTDERGVFLATYAAPEVPSPRSLAVVAVAEFENMAAETSAQITVLPATPPGEAPPVPLSVAVSLAYPEVRPGETVEVAVHVSRGAVPVAGARVSFSVSEGEISPVRGLTDEDGDFSSAYTAPSVTERRRYAINAVVQTGDSEGRGVVLATVTPPMPPPDTPPPRGSSPPSAYVDDVHPNPAVEGQDYVTFRGHGTDSDGDVVECRWIFPDGSSRTVPGSADSFVLNPNEVQAGEILFTVRDNDGLWSQRVSIDLYFEEEGAPWIWGLAAVPPAVAALILVQRALRGNKRKREQEDESKTRHGSIFADSDPRNALVFLDAGFRGLSPMTIHQVPAGPHVVEFLKLGHFKGKEKVIVAANRTSRVRCELEEIPGLELKVSANPSSVPADGRSPSMLTIGFEDKDEHRIPVPQETEIQLEASQGAVTSPVKIPGGEISTTATFTASLSPGKARVAARCGPWEGSVTIELRK